MVKRIAMIGLVGVLLMATTYVMAEEVLATQKGVKYHKETCRLIKNKDNATKMEKSEAVHAGLEPCRKCYKEDLAAALPATSSAAVTESK
ncbi:MAG TPA: hypothetical protein DD723_08890 [Candidatus Omnitrophica bacterium]|nr:MAG: hypothetical protein A2Z81_08490 [Omnitrophica WOR_2 bacterium GWA2_45_18]OGX19361.1 MAG: hypothetical protein A2Y04_01985 [Omnitrophica WOR_2 bacterium GWC2_45_7]HBR15632.1 hypothetical protein [Candidatus Omnitrophota bacterium]